MRQGAITVAQLNSISDMHKIAQDVLTTQLFDPFFHLH